MVGAALNARTASTHRDIFLKHFNSATCENEMKFGYICDLRGNYRSQGADDIYNLCRENGISLRGHNFIWNSNIPPDEFNAMPAAEIEKMMDRHMSFMARRYPEIYCWDVVNEAIGTDITRNSLWHGKFGDNYFDIFFKTAARIFPNTQLFYNEDDEARDNKCEAICTLVMRSLESGLRIDGLGLQCHIDIYNPRIDKYEAALEKYASLGIRLHITELDVSYYDYDTGNYDSPPADLTERHARVYGDYYSLFRRYSESIDCVTTWGVADDSTWLRNWPVRNRLNWPLLFDENHEPKEAFYRITDF